MPTDADMDTITGADNGEGDTSAPKGAKDFNFKLDTASLQREIREGVVGGLQQAFRSAAPQQIDPEEQLLEIGEDDDQATVIQKSVHNALIPQRREIKQFRNFGLDKLGNLTATQELSSKPYYSDYKAEIDAQVAQLPPEYRADANTLRTVYKNVIADHIDEITAKKVDAQKRAEQLSNEPGAPARNNTRVQGKTGGNTVPTPEELGFNDEQLAEIEARGGPDRFARTISLGRYQTWSDYAAGVAKMNATPKTPRGRQIMWKRIGDKKTPSQSA